MPINCHARFVIFSLLVHKLLHHLILINVDLYELKEFSDFKTLKLFVDHFALHHIRLNLHCACQSCRYE